MRQRRRRRLEVEERPRRAERETARERRLAAAEERTRIARDLHDSAAHAINVILVQAGAARLLQERDPAAVRAALSTIEDVARETIGEIDVLVHGLREDDGAEGSAAVEPPLSLAALDTLAERHRAGGMAIEVHVEGRAGRWRAASTRPPIGSSRSRSPMRRVTATALRASASTTAPAGSSSTIANPVPAAAGGASGAGGHGILGMRERAALLGGTLEAGADGNGFRVHARLPYGGEEKA